MQWRGIAMERPRHEKEVWGKPERQEGDKVDCRLMKRFYVKKHPTVVFEAVA